MLALRNLQDKLVGPHLHVWLRLAVATIATVILIILLLIVLLLLCFCRKKADNGRVASGTWTERDDKAEGARGGAGGSAEGSYEKAVEMQDVVMKTDKVGLL